MFRVAANRPSSTGTPLSQAFRRLFVLALVAGFALVGPRSALHANADAPPTPPPFSQGLQDCIQQPSPQGGFGPHGCVYVNGQWVPEQQGSGPIGAPAPSSTHFGAIFAVFIALVIVWSLVPFGIGVALASSRGESVGVAVLLILVLGWIGLAIVYFGQRRTLDAVEGALDRAAEHRHDAPGSWPT